LSHVTSTGEDAHPRTSGLVSLPLRDHDFDLLRHDPALLFLAKTSLSMTRRFRSATTSSTSPSKNPRSSSRRTRARSLPSASELVLAPDAGVVRRVQPRERKIRRHPTTVRTRRRSQQVPPIRAQARLQVHHRLATSAHSGARQLKVIWDHRPRSRSEQVNCFDPFRRVGNQTAEDKHPEQEHQPLRN
jgi:hypothetical protein